MGVAIITLITLLATALLPVLVLWLNKQMEKPGGIEQLRQTNAVVSDTLGRALAAHDPVGVAAAFSRHDELLRNAGITSAPHGNRGGVAGASRRRELAGQRRVDANAHGVRTRVTDSTRVVREPRSRITKEREAELSKLPGFQPFD